jgi:ankyrin repeat protein
MERLRELLPRAIPDELNTQLPRWMMGGGTLLRAAVSLGAVQKRGQKQDPDALEARLCAELIQLLIAAGADADTMSFGGSSEGLTPLMASIGRNTAACRALLAGRADVDKPDGAGYAPLLAASEWKLPDDVSLLLSYGARTDVEAAPDGDVGYTPLIAAVVSAERGCVQMLLDARADPYMKFQKKSPLNGRRLPPMDAIGWARYFEQTVDKGRKGERHLIVRELTKFDQFCERLLSLSVLDQAGIDALKGELERGEATRSTLIQRHFDAVNEAMQAEESVRKADEISKRLAFESERQPVADELLPRSEQPMYGGAVQLEGLVKAPHLNGEEGTCISYNVGGNRRVGVRLTKTKKTLAFNPRNVVAVDRKPLPTCSHTSAEACEALCTELERAGSSCRVVDWTPLAADPNVDQAHLHWMGRISPTCEPFRRTLFYVQRTSETEAHMLLGRELMNNGTMNDAGVAFTLPWIVYGGGDSNSNNASEGHTITPSASEWCAELSYITRLVVGATSESLTCSVCLEGTTVFDSPSQLPCFHVLCVPCMKKLFPIGKRGLKCPSCQRQHSKWSLEEMATAPGGVCVVEHLADPK